MKKFATVALSALVIAVMIGVYVNQGPQNTTEGERASGIEPAAGQQPASDAVEESIKRIEKTMQEMEKRNNSLKPEDKKADKVGDQSRTETPETPGIENLNAPTEPTGDGVTEIIHAESMKGDNTQKTGENAADTADRVQEIQPAAGDIEDAKDTVQDKREQAQPETSGDIETDIDAEKQQ